MVKKKMAAAQEPQLFELAMASTVRDLGVAFSLKNKQQTALKLFLCKEGILAILF